MSTPLPVTILVLQVVKVTGVPSTGMTRTILMRGSNRLVLDEAERSVHDALCVVRSLVSLESCLES